MKYIKQLSIILLISFLGELIHYLLPLPIPASIYGLILLFVALLTGIVPLSAVKETGNFLIEIMPLMFIPSAVGLMESRGILQPVLVPYAVMIVASTVVVMAIAGLVTQFVIHRKGGRSHE